MRPDWYQRLPVLLISEVAQRHRLDPYLVAAICQKESGGVALRTRFEPHYRYLFEVRTFASNQGITAETEEAHQRTSFGLMQVMGAVARERGYRGFLVSLATDPELGIECGCRHLKWLSERHYIAEESDLISSYNQGGPYKTAGGQYRNFRYVDEVDRMLRELRSY